MRLWQQAVYLYGNNQAFKYVSKMATEPSLLTFRNRRASWNKYALNQLVRQQNLWVVSGSGNLPRA